jgi:Flp pilus assembly protein TadG
MRARVRRADAGAAAVDFVMIAVLLVFLLLAVLQVAVYFYARNVVAASAADAARYAAAESVDPAAGGPRAERLVHQGLDEPDARGVKCTGAPGRDAASGLAVTRVRCTGHLRLLFTPLPVPLDLDATAAVLREGRP